MARRICLLALLAMPLFLQTGCRSNMSAPWPCGRTWYGCSCGDFWWHEWFSHPPECCDPCCGPCFAGCKTRWVQGCPGNHGINQGYADHDGWSEDDGYSESMNHMQPTPAREELPPGVPSAARANRRFEQLVAYDEAGPPRRSKTPPRGRSMRKPPTASRYNNGPNRY